MKIAIIISPQDLASKTIGNALLQRQCFHPTHEEFDGKRVLQCNGYNEARLYTIVQESIHAEHLDVRIAADLFIFATKHVSKAAVPSLCVHAPGNWGPALYGGKANSLGIAPASYLKTALQKLEELHTLHHLLNYEVIQEATHHGPLLEKPCMFIEIGSTEKEWQDEQAAEIIAATILFLIEQTPKEYPTALGIGGLHHTPQFKKIILQTERAIGHVCPKYNLAYLTPTMIQQGLEKTHEKTTQVILDWKGLGDEKDRIVQMLDELHISYTKIR